MYVKVTNGIPENYTIGQMRRDNPNTSFPKSISETVLASYNVFSLVFTERPNVDYTKNTTEALPQQINGVWTQVWTISDASPEQVAERVSEKSQSVRSWRDYLLQKTDWMALSDNTLTAEWATYRQALRDITDHVNFPYLADEDWPVKPV